MERCGGTPEAQATRYALERPTLAPPAAPVPAAVERRERDVLVVPVLILPVLVVTATPTPEPDPADTLIERRLEPPVQLPEGE